MKETRRSFLKRLAFNRAGDRKAVVEEADHVFLNIFLRGGADTLNMLIPYGDDDYYRARPTLGIKSGGTILKPSADVDLAVKLDDFYALHPRMAPLRRIYQEGRLAFVQAVGSDNVSGSHFEAQDQMEHGEAYHRRLQGGWLGRHLFYRPGRNSRDSAYSPLAAVAFGNTIPEVLRGAPTVAALQSVDEVELKGGSGAILEDLSALYRASRDDLGRAGADTLRLLDRIASMKASRSLLNSGSGGVDYPDCALARSLAEVARLVKAELGLNVACVDHGGWDTHFIQGGAQGLQAGSIDELARSLDAFDKDLVRDNLRSRVTVLVITEFGRRSYENSSMGTDHGRAFSLFIISDRVRGGRVIGEWPGLAEVSDPLHEPKKVLRRIPGLEEDLDVGPAGLSVLIDYRDVLYALTETLLGNSQVAKVFPGFKPSAAKNLAELFS